METDMHTGVHRNPPLGLGCVGMHPVTGQWDC